MGGRFGRVLSTGNVSELAMRVIKRAFIASGADQLDFPLDRSDITDSHRVRWQDRPQPAADSSLVIGWICAPPGPGSGGHTTMFRMIAGLEAAGHTCIVHLHDRHGVDLPQYEAVVRTHWPRVRAAVVDVAAGLITADVYMATSWQTAHVLGTQFDVPGRRMYFVQDYEPYFYPAGSEYALAEDTYRFGFDIIALGAMVHDSIKANTGISSHLVPFGCDTGVYRYSAGTRRRGIVFYSRPDTPRRGALLAALAVDEFHSRHPEHTIHLIGPRPPMLLAPAVEHRFLAPAELAELYNTTVAGIGMSFTNISLVVEEMLMCGTIPVVNDSINARADIDHPNVEWADATPSAIADALCRTVERSDVAAYAALAASRTRPGSWDDSADDLVRILESLSLASPLGREDSR